MSKHYEMLSVTDTWYEAWKILIHHFIKFILVSAVPIFIIYAFGWAIFGSFVFSASFLDNPAELFNASSGFVYFLIIALLIIIIAEFWGTISLILLTIKQADIKISRLIYQSLEFFGTFIILALLTILIAGIVTLADYIIITVLTALLGLINAEWVNAIFPFLSYITTLSYMLMSVFLLFAPYFIVDQSADAWSAIRKSFRLSKHYFWPILIRLAILYSVIYTVSFLLKFIPNYGDPIAIILSLPITTIYAYVLYNNLKQKNT
ncbi:MAG: hypothetical protein V1898_03710 [Patescibacteria group bacterium]